MPLVEIIRGEQTSDEALAKAYDVVLQIRKTPIVVNDSRGFYTSRVIGTMVNEGLAMLAEGVHPMSLERAATQDGYPVGTAPALRRAEHGADGQDRQGHARTPPRRAGTPYDEHPGGAVVAKMIELGRPSRLKGAGFYEYVDGKRQGLWPGLAEAFPPAAEQPPFADVKDRMLFAEALETAKCFEEGVIESSAAANIGSIMGIGFPPNTGGAAQFMTGYEGSTAGTRPDRAAGVPRPGRRARRGVRRAVPARRRTSASSRRRARASRPELVGEALPGSHPSDEIRIESTTPSSWSRM